MVLLLKVGFSLEHNHLTNILSQTYTEIIQFYFQLVLIHNYGSGCQLFNSGNEKQTKFTRRISLFLLLCKMFSFLH